MNGASEATNARAHARCTDTVSLAATAVTGNGAHEKVETADEPPLLVTGGLLALLLGVSKRHIERLDVSGKLPDAVRLGRSKRWRRAEIEAWLLAGCPDRAHWEAQCAHRSESSRPATRQNSRSARNPLDEQTQSTPATGRRDDTSRLLPNAAKQSQDND